MKYSQSHTIRIAEAALKAARTSLHEDNERRWYRARFVEMFGSVLAAIWFERVLYWWEKHDRQPFFKFNAPCTHKCYRKGDSWQEELCLSRTELDTARTKAATKIKRGMSKSDKLTWCDEHGQLLSPAHLVLYYTTNNMTWYEINDTLLDAYLLKYYGGLPDAEILHSLGMLKPCNPQGMQDSSIRQRTQDSGIRQEMQISRINQVTQDSGIPLDSPSPSPNPTPSPAPSPPPSIDLDSGDESNSPQPVGGGDGGDELWEDMPLEMGQFLETLHGDLLAQVQALDPAVALAWYHEVKTGRNPAGLLRARLDKGEHPSPTNVVRARQTLDTRAHLRVLADEAANRFSTLVSPESASPPQDSPITPPRDPSLDEHPQGNRLSWFDIWHAVMGHLSLQLNPSTYSQWVAGAKALRYADGVLTVRARHPSARDWLAQRMNSTIEPLVRGLAGVDTVRVEYWADGH